MENKQKTTKSAQKAVNKYISNKYDRVNLTMPKGKKAEYKAKADAAGKSLNKYIIDCIESSNVDSGKAKIISNLKVTSVNLVPDAEYNCRLNNDKGQP